MFLIYHFLKFVVNKLLFVVLLLTDHDAKNSEKHKNAADSTQQSTDVEKQNSLKKKRGKRSGKKSNKASPSDSPLKTVRANKGPSNDPTKEEDVPTIDKVQSIAEPSSSSSITSNTTAKGPQAKRQNQTVKGWKGSKHALQPDEPPKMLLKDVENAQSKQKDSTTKLNSKDLRNVKEQRSSNIREIKRDKPAFNISEQENGEVQTTNLFERDPLVLLKAAVHLIKPRKKVISYFEDIFVVIVCGGCVLLCSILLTLFYSPFS